MRFRGFVFLKAAVHKIHKKYFLYIYFTQRYTDTYIIRAFSLPQKRKNIACGGYDGHPLRTPQSL